MQGKIKHSSLDFNAFYYKINSIVTDKTLANLLKKIIILDNLTTQGLTSLDPLKTPATDTLKIPTYYSKLPKSTNTLKTLPSRNLLPKSTNAELEVMRRLNAEIIKDVTVVASCILDPNYR
ncbi:hypothetical protein K504DRAFT_452206 [Pleomassaria siparia CBS 279.74]|uniref:Uncharacterized protein n=1 Tax=Pleomassaria siparia CBS 279.74 TaxID=1314801 RepID=A0A6G1KH38_9PLEO|nr:hypothetical protein K504DRAFT_452206 [Pleomassaria siparia CBS 279.74]